MKFTKSNNPTGADIALIALIVFFFFLYFVVYLTPSRTAWYTEMQNQLIILFDEITHIGR